MLLCGLVVTRRGYSPAFYFSLANFILVLGGILFIMREVNIFPDHALTRYAVQYGVLAQVVLFSLGLSDRLNQTQSKLGLLALEKERERKQLLEEQSQLLQQKVQEQTADLLSLNHLKDKLLYMISHDLRNPLASLDSFMNLLLNHQNKLTEHEQATLAQKAKQSLSNLNQLLTNLLLWSRSQTSQVVFRPEWTELEAVIARNIQLHSLDVELKNIQIEVAISDTPRLFADAEMLDFVVRNLLGNAIKFSHRNGRIEVQTRSFEKYNSLSISDNGVGMTPHQIEQVLSKRVVSSTRGTAKEKGSGLGLVLCREFLEMHGGTLHIVSTHQGTAVTCHWPSPTALNNI
jgi:two-component system, sensor histidine kinase LadS